MWTMSYWPLIFGVLRSATALIVFSFFISIYFFNSFFSISTKKNPMCRPQIARPRARALNLAVCSFWPPPMMRRKNHLLRLRFFSLFFLFLPHRLPGCFFDRRDLHLSGRSVVILCCFLSVCVHQLMWWSSRSWHAFGFVVIFYYKQLCATFSSASFVVDPWLFEWSQKLRLIVFGVLDLWCFRCSDGMQRTGFGTCAFRACALFETC